MDNETLEMLATSLRPLLSKSSSSSLTDQLSELGWQDVVAEDPAQARVCLFSIKGEVISGADALGPLMAGVFAEKLAQPALVEATVVLPSGLQPEKLSVRVVADGVRGTGVVTATPPPHSTILVPVPGADGLRIAEFDRTQISISQSGEGAFTPLTGFDSDFGLLSCDIRIPNSAITWHEGHQAANAWEAVVAASRWAIAAELTGLAHHVIREAVAYTGERIQYGQSIGAFQALQHRLGSSYSTLVGATDLAQEASRLDDRWSAKVAKAAAGRAAEDACTQAQQCYGAIGFTWEHEFHRYLRRVYLLDRLFGDYRTLEFEIGTELQATGHVPRIGSL